MTDHPNARDYANLHERNAAWHFARGKRLFSNQQFAAADRALGRALEQDDLASHFDTQAREIGL